MTNVYRSTVELVVRTKATLFYVCAVLSSTLFIFVRSRSVKIINRHNRNVNFECLLDWRVWFRKTLPNLSIRRFPEVCSRVHYEIRGLLGIIDSVFFYLTEKIIPNDEIRQANFLSHMNIPSLSLWNIFLRPWADYRLCPPPSPRGIFGTMIFLWYVAFRKNDCKFCWGFKESWAFKIHVNVLDRFIT